MATRYDPKTPLPATIGLHPLARLLGCKPKAEAVCCSKYLNILAARKPFRHPAKSFASEEQYHEAFLAQQCGIDMPVFDSKASFMQGFDAKWKHAAPRGINSQYNEPYRILDFVDYVHSPDWKEEQLPRMLTMIWNGFLEKNIAGENVLESTKIKFTMDGVDPDGWHDLVSASRQLFPADFEGAPIDISKYYAGMAFVNESRDRVYFVSAGELASDQMQVLESTIPRSLAHFPENKTLYVVPVLMSWKQETLSETMDGKVVTLNGAYWAMKRIPVGDAIVVRYKYIATTSGVNIALTVENNSGEEVTLSPLFAYLMSEAVFDSADYSEISAKITEWIDDGTIYEEGIRVTDGTFGDGVYCRYIDFGGQTLAADEKKTFVATISPGEDDFGNPYNQWSELRICYTDSISKTRRMI